MPIVYIHIYICIYIYTTRIYFIHGFHQYTLRHQKVKKFLFFFFVFFVFSLIFFNFRLKRGLDRVCFQIKFLYRGFIVFDGRNLVVLIHHG
jgi:tryptophan-rich sensory protein